MFAHFGTKMLKVSYGIIDIKENAINTYGDMIQRYDLNKINLTIKDGWVEIEEKEDDLEKTIGQVETYLCKKDYNEDGLEYKAGQIYKFRKAIGEFFDVFDEKGCYVGDSEDWFYDYFIKVKE